MSHTHVLVCVLLKSTSTRCATSGSVLHSGASCSRTSYCLFLPAACIVSLEALKAQSLPWNIRSVGSQAVCMCGWCIFLTSLQLASDLNGICGPRKPGHVFHLIDACGVCPVPGPQRMDQLLQVPWAWGAHRILPPAQCLRKGCSQHVVLLGAQPSATH